MCISLYFWSKFNAQTNDPVENLVNWENIKHLLEYLGSCCILYRSRKILPKANNEQGRSKQNRTCHPVHAGVSPPF